LCTLKLARSLGLSLCAALFASAIGLNTAAAGADSGASTAPAAPPDDPLPPGAALRLGSPRFHHDAPLHYVEFAPDGKSFVTQGEDGVRVWDAATHRVIRHFDAASDSETMVAQLSPDGRLLATLEVAYQGSKRARRASAPSVIESIGAIRVRELASGRIVRAIAPLPMPMSWIKLCFSPDGGKLAGVSRIEPDNPNSKQPTPEPNIFVWNLSGEENFRVWPVRSAARIWDFLFSGDGKSLIFGCDDGAIHVWDAATGESQRDIGEDLGVVARLALSPDGTRLASLGQRFLRDVTDLDRWVGDDFVRVWDTASGKLLRKLKVAPGLTHVAPPERPERVFIELSSLRFSPDGKLLLTGDPDRLIRVWNIESGKEVRRIDSAGGVPGMLALSPDNRELIVAPLRREVVHYWPPGHSPVHYYLPRSVPSDWFQLFDFESGRELFRPSGHARGITLSAFSPDSRLVVTGAPGSEIVLWDAKSGRELQRMVGHHGNLTALAWADRGLHILSAATDKTLRVWEPATGKELRRVSISVDVEADWLLGPRNNTAVSPDGKYMAVIAEKAGTKNNEALLFDTARGNEVCSLAVQPGKVATLAFTPDSQNLLLGSNESFLHCWNIAADTEGWRKQIRDGKNTPMNQYYLPIQICRSTDGEVVVETRRDSALTMVDTASEKVIRELTRRLNFGEICTAISADSRTLAWAGGVRDPAIILYEKATGLERCRLHNRNGLCLSLSFSSDGKLLFTGADDGTAFVWNLHASVDSEQDKRASKKSMAQLWADLRGDSGQAAFAAIKVLSSRGDAAVRFVNDSLPPTRAIEDNDERVGQLIRVFENGSPEECRKAIAELDDLGGADLKPVKNALAGSLPPRVKAYLDEMHRITSRDLNEPTPAHRQELRALEVLEWINTPAARKVIEGLAAGDPGRRTGIAKAVLTRLNETSR
jgi:WD40 repeat protein